MESPSIEKKKKTKKSKFFNPDVTWKEKRCFSRLIRRNYEYVTNVHKNYILESFTENDEDDSNLVLSQIIVDKDTFKLTNLFTGRISSWVRDTSLIKVENDEFYYLDGNSNSIVKQSLVSEAKSVLSFKPIEENPPKFNSNPKVARSYEDFLFIYTTTKEEEQVILKTNFSELRTILSTEGTVSTGIEWMNELYNNKKLQVVATGTFNMNLHAKHAFEFQEKRFITDVVTGETIPIVHTCKSSYHHAYAGEKAFALLCGNNIEVWDTKIENLLWTKYIQFEGSLDEIWLSEDAVAVIGLTKTEKLARVFDYVKDVELLTFPVSSIEKLPGKNVFIIEQNEKLYLVDVEDPVATFKTESYDVLFVTDNLTMIVQEKETNIYIIEGEEKFLVGKVEGKLKYPKEFADGFVHAKVGDTDTEVLIDIGSKKMLKNSSEPFLGGYYTCLLIPGLSVKSSRKLQLISFDFEGKSEIIDEFSDSNEQFFFSSTSSNYLLTAGSTKLFIFDAKKTIETRKFVLKAKLKTGAGGNTRIFNRSKETIVNTYNLAVDPGFRMCVWKPELEESFHLIKEPGVIYSTEVYIYDSKVIYIELLANETYQLCVRTGEFLDYMSLCIKIPKAKFLKVEENFVVLSITQSSDVVDLYYVLLFDGTLRKALLIQEESQSLKFVQNERKTEMLFQEFDENSWKFTEIKDGMCSVETWIYLSTKLLINDNYLLYAKDALDVHPHFISHPLDESGDSLLHKLVQEQKSDILKSLLIHTKSKNLNFLTFNSKNESPLSIAISLGNRELIDLLIEYCVAGTIHKYRKAFVNAIPLLAQRYPSVLSDVLCYKLALEPAHKSELEDLERCGIEDAEICGDEVDAKRKLWRQKFEDYEKDLGHPLVSGYVVPLPHIVGGIAPSELPASPLHAIAKYNAKEALENDIMKAVLKFKWENYGRAIFITQAIMYLIFTLVFTVDMILFANEEIEQSLQEVYLNSGVGKFRIFLELLIGIYLIYYIQDELRQFFKEGREYLTSIWNWLDIISYSLVIITFGAHFARAEWQWVPVAPTIVIIWVKILFFARGNSQMGPFVRMLLQIGVDIRYFLIILAVIVFGFSVAFLVIIRGGSSDFRNIAWAIFSNYRLIFGDNSTIFSDSLENLFQDYYVMSRLLYVAFSFIVSLILLNILIAIMSNSFASIQENNEKEWRFEFAQILVEIETNHMWLHRFTRFRTKNTRPFSPKWLHVLAPTDSDWGKKRLENVDLQLQLKQITEQLQEIKKALELKK